MQIKKDERNEIKSTSHSRYRCQYHIVFAPKYRRKEIYGQLKKDIGEILRTLCKQKNVEILEAEACVDHIHMLVSTPPYLSVAQFMGFLKGKSSLMIFDRHTNLKYKYGSRNFWCRGYYVDTVGRNKKIIQKHSTQINSRGHFVKLFAPASSLLTALPSFLCHAAGKLCTIVL